MFSPENNCKEEFLQSQVQLKPADKLRQITEICGVSQQCGDHQSQKEKRTWERRGEF